MFLLKGDAPLDPGARELGAYLLSCPFTRPELQAAFTRLGLELISDESLA